MRLNQQHQQNERNNLGLGSLKNIFDDLGDFTRNNANLFSGIPIVGQVAAIGAGISQQNVNRQLQASEQEKYNNYLAAQQQEAISKNITTKNSFFEQNKEIIIVSLLGITILTVVAIKSKNNNSKKSNKSKNR